MKENYLTQDDIKSIKYFIKKEEEKHKSGDWDKFQIESLRILSDGGYSFNIHYTHAYPGCCGDSDDYWLTGNLFYEFPRNAVMDHLDAVQLLFYRIHCNAYIRVLKYRIFHICQLENNFKYIESHYKPDSTLNKDNKIIKDPFEEQKELFNKIYDGIDNLKYIE